MKDQSMTSTDGHMDKQNGMLPVRTESYISCLRKTGRQSIQRLARNRTELDDHDQTPTTIRSTPHRKPKPSQVEPRTRVPPGIELHTRVSPEIQQLRPRISPGDRSYMRTARDRAPYTRIARTTAATYTHIARTTAGCDPETYYVR